VPRVWDNLVHIHSIHGQCQVRVEFDSRSWGCGHGITRLICYSLVFTLDNCGSGADKEGPIAIAIYHYNQVPASTIGGWSSLTTLWCWLRSVWAVSLPLLMLMLLRLQWLQFISLQVRGMSISFLLLFFWFFSCFFFFLLIAELNFSDLMRMHTHTPTRKTNNSQSLKSEAF